MILSFRTDMPGQTVQTQIRLLLIRVYTVCLPAASFGLITLWQSHKVQILEWLQQIFGVSEYLGNLRYLFEIVKFTKIPKYSDTRKIAVIILKFAQCGSTVE